MVKKYFKANFHICENCNYHCGHCFAKFGKPHTLRAEHWKKITDNVISSGLINEVNIAGGEPFIHSEFIDILKNIGRCTVNNQIISEQDFSRKIFLLKEVNPDINIKINTVVSALNVSDCISDNIRYINIARWKILKMQVFDDGFHCNSHISVSDRQYDSYVRKSFESLGLEFIPEKTLYRFNNTEIVAERFLQGGYIMIGADGFLLDDTLNSSYTKVCDCLTESFADGIEKLNFNRSLYSSRY